MVILTDNKPTSDTANSQHNRLLSHLKQVVNVSGATVVYLEGEKKIVPDFLTRYQAPKLPAAACKVDLNTDMAFLDNIAEVQSKDVPVSEVIEQIRNSEDVHHHYFKKFKGRDPITTTPDNPGKDVLFIKEGETTVPVIPLSLSLMNL